MWNNTRISRKSRLAVTLILVTAARARAADSPRDVVVTTTNGVIEILKDKSLSHETKVERIEDVVYANVDFDTLSRLVLAQNWKALSPQQQKDFEDEFKKHLSVTYSRNIDNYRDEGVAVVGERDEARGDHTVMTHVVRGDAAARPSSSEFIAVDYRLRQKDGRWHIIDVIVEGVSLVANFRSQFQDIIGSGSPAKLIDLLREKNAKGETIVTPVVSKKGATEEETPAPGAEP